MLDAVYAFQSAYGLPVDGQAVGTLEGIDRFEHLLIERVRQADRRQLRQEIPQKRQIVPHCPHADAAVAGAEGGLVLPLRLRDGQPLACQLRELLHAVVDLLDLVPRRLADDTVGIETENLLERPDGVLRLRAEHTVKPRDRGDGGVVAPDAVELALDRAHVLADAPAPQRPPRVRRNVSADGRVRHKADVAAVVVLQDLIGRHALLREVNAPPLGEPAALCAHPVAELGEERLNASLTDDVVVEDVVDDLADVLEDAPVGDEGLVELCRAGDVVVIAPRAVILRIDPVECKGDLREDVRADGTLRPGGVDLARSNILDVLREGHGHILRRRAGRAEVDNDALRHNGLRHIVPSFTAAAQAPRAESSPCAHRWRRRAPHRARTSGGAP